MAIEISFHKGETIGQGIARTLAENQIPSSPKGLGGFCLPKILS
jgi:hypothetical protein